MLKTLCTALALVVAGGGVVLGSPVAPQPTVKLPIVPIANGCGRGYFRTLAGECFPNQRIYGRRGLVAPPPCPRGYVRDPDPGRPLCYPVY